MSATRRHGARRWGGCPCHEAAKQNSPGLQPWVGFQKRSALKGRPKGMFVRRVSCLATHREQILNCHKRDGHARNLVRAPFQRASIITVIPRAKALGYSVMPLRGIRRIAVSFPLDPEIFSHEIVQHSRRQKARDDEFHEMVRYDGVTCFRSFRR